MAESHWEQGPKISESDPVQFFATWRETDLLDVLLTLTELHPDDKEKHTYEVTTFHLGPTSVSMRVDGARLRAEGKAWKYARL